ncbi:MAG TPA: hypothetical protein VIM28_07345 [Solirubrobacterales bacterium]
MPVAATRLTDIGAGDPQPLVFRRSAQHPLQQLAVAGLEFGPILQLAPRDTDPGRQRVADGLEIAETQRPRLPRKGTDAGIDLDAGKGVGEDGTELRLETADLTPQLNSGEPLVAVYAKRRSASVSVEQIRHSPKRV